MYWLFLKRAEIFWNSVLYTTTVFVAIQHWEMAWPARYSRLTQRDTNHYITMCASVLPSWMPARTISWRPFCRASVIFCMLYLLELRAVKTSNLFKARAQLFKNVQRNSFFVTNTNSTDSIWPQFYDTDKKDNDIYAQYAENRRCSTKISTDLQTLIWIFKRFWCPNGFKAPFI